MLRNNEILSVFETGWVYIFQYDAIYIYIYTYIHDTCYVMVVLRQLHIYFYVASGSSGRNEIQR